METPASYIPLDRRLAIARGEALPDRVAGAALTADISGFTPLTEILVATLGMQRGAEELPSWLNRVYDALIAPVDQHGGSVIGFSGDAMICWFDADPGTRAAACALAMQDAMEPFAACVVPGGGSVALAVKIAIVAGPARRLVAGDPAIQRIDVLAGATLERLASVESRTLPGEVALDARTARDLAGRLVIRSWREDPPSGTQVAVVVAVLDPPVLPPIPSEAPLSDEALRQWLLPPVYERLRHGQGEYLAELRPAVALFLRFGGFDYDGDDMAGERLDRYIRWVQHVLARYGGTLIQLTIGEKGSYLYAAFGAPIAHDDNAARAAGAALDLRVAPADAGVGPSASGTSLHLPQMGIGSGQMRAGAYGGVTRRTYGVLGDEVNLAARLMAMAQPGQILVSPRVADTLAEHFTLDALGMFQVRGKRDPLAIAAVRGRREPSDGGLVARFPLPPLGREAERARLGEILMRAEWGEGAIVRFEAAAGMGKSHLAASVAADASARGFRVLEGVCQGTCQDIPYTPWQRIATALFDLGPGRGTEQVEALHRYVSRLDPAWLLRFPLLGDLLQLPIPDSSTTAALDPKLRRAALLELLVGVFHAEALARPLLLLIDDAHWIDEASEALLSTLGRSLADRGIVLALAHRPGVDGRAIAPDLDGLPHAHRIPLGALGPEVLREIVGRRLGAPSTPVAASLVAIITQGNPYFAEALTDALRDGGNVVRRDDGVWWLSGGLFRRLRQAGCLVRTGPDGAWDLLEDAALARVDLGLPDSIQRATLVRLDRLPEEPGLTLKVASVIGHTFLIDALLRVHPVVSDPPTLAAHLALLEGRSFLLRDAGAPWPRATFLQHLTREVVYDTLLYAQRERLHHAVSAALIEISPEDVGQIAFHSFAGADWPHALRYGLLAGRQAQRLFANHAAIEHYRKPLQSAGALPPLHTATERQEIHGALGELYLATGEYDQGRAHLDQALGIAQAQGDAIAQARAARLIARLHELRGDYPAALDWCMRACQMLDGPAPDVVEALVTAGLIQTRQGDYPQAKALGEEALAMAEALGDGPAMARALGLLGIVDRRRGNTQVAIAEFERSIALYRQAGNVHGEGLVHNEIANCFFALGRWNDADARYRSARAIFSQIGDQYNWAFAANNLGGIARNQGRFDDALAYYGEGLRALDAIGGSPYVTGVFSMNLGATAIGRRDLAMARGYLARGATLFAAAQSRDFLPELHRLQAEVALLAGDSVAALHEARISLDLARELALPGEEGSTLRVLGELARVDGDLPRAETLLRESQARQREVGDAYEEGRSLLSLARVLAERGQDGDALAALDAALATFERLAATHDLIVAHTLRATLAEGPPRR